MRWLLFILVLVVHAAWAEKLVGKVIGISDGDTLTILDSAKRQHKIRLAGIDSPEPKQAFGTASRQSLSKLAFGKAVIVEYHKRDRYGRLVGKVYVEDLDICLEQIKRGLAWHYKQYELEQNVDDRIAYAIAEVRARNANAGLWSDRQPVPPWQWRASLRTKVKAPVY